MKKRNGFSLLELSIVLLVIAVIIGMITQSSDVLQTARLAAARNITKSSVVNDTSGLILWLDSTSEDSFNSTNIDDGTAVATWNDIKPSKTTAQYNAIQASSGSQPLYKKGMINDLPAVTFDGINDYMTIPNYQANAYMTLFMVAKCPAHTENLFIEQSVLSSANDGFYLWGSGLGPTDIRRSPNGIGNPSNIRWFTLAVPGIAVMRYDGTNISYKRNSDSFINTAASSVVNSPTIATLYIGSRAGSSIFSDCSMGEIIMFDRALSDTEVSDIVTYLTKKWQIE